VRLNAAISRHRIEQRSGPVVIKGLLLSMMATAIAFALLWGYPALDGISCWLVCKVVFSRPARIPGYAGSEHAWLAFPAPCAIDFGLPLGFGGLSLVYLRPE
jgi:hypothetical protein